MRLRLSLNRALCAGYYLYNRDGIHIESGLCRAGLGLGYEVAG